MQIIVESEHESYPVDVFMQDDAIKMGRFIEGSHGIRFGDINVVLMQDGEHTALNIKYLEHEYSTDILTFDLSFDDCISGDVYINAEVCAQNAVEYGVEFKVEFYRLMAHGMLHLVGLDDATDEEKLIMRAQEDLVLRSCLGEGFM